MNPIYPIRIVIPLMLLLSATLAGLGSMPYMSLDGDRHVEAESIEQVRQLTKQLQTSINIMLRSDNFAGVTTQLTTLATESQLNFAMVIDDQGKVITAAHQQHRGKNISELAPFVKDIELSSLFKFNKGVILLSDDKMKVRAVYPVQLVESVSNTQYKQSGLLVFESNISDDKLLEQSMMMQHAKMFLINTVGLSIMMWVLFHFLLTRRVNQLVEVTTGLAKGDLSIRSGLRGKDELARIGKALDIMANKLYAQQYEQAVSEERLRKSQMFANMGSWAWDIKTGDVSWSETIAPMFGINIDHDEVSYDLFINLVHPGDRWLVELSVQNCLQKGEKYDVIHRIVKPDGVIRWMHETGDVELDETGDPVRMLGMMRDITEQKEFNDRLQLTNKEVNYQKYALDQHSIVAVTDLKGVITYANDKFSEVSGYSNEELVGNTHNLVNSGYHPKEFFNGLWGTVASGKIWRGEVCNKSKKGDLYWMATTVVPHFDEDDLPDQYTVIRTDITERVVAQQLAMEERELLEVINSVQSKFLHDSDPMTGFENLLQALLVFTGSEYGFIGEVLFNDEHKHYLKTMALTNIAWNSETRALYEKQAVNGLEFYNMETLSGRVLSTGKPVFANDPFLEGLPEGHPEVNAFLGVPLYMGEKLIGMVGIANRKDGYNEKLLEYLQPLVTTCTRIIDSYRREISRKQVESDLVRFKSTLDKIQDSVFMFEPDALNFLYVNQGGIDQFGYSKDELMEMTPIDIKPDISETDFREMLLPLIAGPNHTITFETRHRRKDGLYIPVEIFLQYVPTIGEPPRFVAFVRDISERLNLQKQLQQAQKMEAIGQLTGGIAHDFNNMLTSIMGFTLLAIEGLEQQGNEEIKDYLSEVYNSSIRARDLVAQMLAFSRGGEEKLEPFKVSMLVNESLKMMGATLPSSITIKHQLNNNLMINTHPVQIHQLMMNLCINARDAMQGKGEIIIGLESVNNIVSKCDSCHEKIHGNYIKLFVRDNGSGIKQEQMNYLFDPFYTTKEVGKGSGMGLSMVHGIMHNHGGHITVDTEADSGTSINLLFPKIKSRLSGINNKGGNVSESSNVIFDGKVLVIDDEVSVGRFIGELLKGFGCHVTVETSSLAALEKFYQAPEHFDLVVTDQTMPDLTGAELVQSMKAVRPNLPVILCTGYSDNIDAVEAASMGIGGFINKPIETDKFRKLLAKLL